MFYPLANDENGHPLEVPSTAVGWLVRRHGGQKGRPAAVFDQEGRPLVVALGATARDLDAAGCDPGPYRLEAVDVDRRPLGLVAFTELAVIEEAGEERRKQHPDAAIEALARAVEAMQRVQLERERVQAEMMAKMIDRLAPAPPQPAPDLRGSLQQLIDLQKTIRRIAESPAAQPAPPAEQPPSAGAEEKDESSTVTERLLTELLDVGVPIIKQVVLAKLGLKPDQIASLTGAPSSAASSAPASIAPTESSAPAPAEPTPATHRAAEVKAKLDAVLALLTPAERKKVLSGITSLPDETLEAAQERLLAITAEEAVKFLRTSFLGADSPSTPTATPPDRAA